MIIYEYRVIVRGEELWVNDKRVEHPKDSTWAAIRLAVPSGDTQGILKAEYDQTERKLTYYPRKEKQ